MTISGLVSLPRIPDIIPLRVSGETTSAKAGIQGKFALGWFALLIPHRCDDVRGHGLCNTYAFRFGKHDIWKIGHTVDLGARLKQVNTQIPTEVVEGTWQAVFQHKWNDEKAAHAMEQRVFAALRNCRTEGERLRCSEADLFDAWKKAIGL